MNIEQLASDEAIATIVSYNKNDLTTEQILEAWQAGEEPDNLGIWEPFDGYTPANLLELFDGFKSQFARFANDLLKTGETK